MSQPKLFKHRHFEQVVESDNIQIERSGFDYNRSGHATLVLSTS